MATVRKRHDKWPRAHLRPRNTMLPSQLPLQTPGMDNVCAGVGTRGSLGASARESPLNTWKRPESVCGEFAGRTTGFSVVVGFSLTDATSVAIWTSRLDKLSQVHSHPPFAILGSEA